MLSRVHNNLAQVPVFRESFTWLYTWVVIIPLQLPQSFPRLIKVIAEKIPARFPLAQFHNIKTDAQKTGHDTVKVLKKTVETDTENITENDGYKK